MPKKNSEKRTLGFQGSLFEDDYLVRTLGTLGYKPDVALTELVANAWDAGASKVSIVIPEKAGGRLVVEDDGVGMTPAEFRERWMTLGYDRVRHQGRDAEFPPERAEMRRRAYGHNGIGRHGLLCFAPRYVVETRNSGFGGRFTVGTTSGRHPFAIEREVHLRRSGHGTKLTAEVQFHLPEPERILNILAARFVHDPGFSVHVNGSHVPLAQHAGLASEAQVVVTPHVSLQVFIVDASLSGQTTQYQGVAFWVAGRLVGEPSWVVGRDAVLDGRTRLAKRYTVVIKADDLFDQVKPDWSGFAESEPTDAAMAAVLDHLRSAFSRLAAERVSETKEAVMNDHAAEISSLQPLARLEIREFVDAFANAQPQVSPEMMAAAVQAAINLEKSRSGLALLEKLAGLSEHDIPGLDRLLTEWTVRDALTVLDEIDRRLAVLEAIKRLSADPDVDELHTLHPLVSQARWLFGPEFDSPEYVANVTLATVVKKLFSQRMDLAFINDRKRPDIVVLKESTLSAVATDELNEESGLATLRDVLVIELKRGAAGIGRVEVNQATGYVEDLLQAGTLDGRPQVRAFVVGHAVKDKVEAVRKIGEPERGAVRVTTYSQLVRMTVSFSSSTLAPMRAPFRRSQRSRVITMLEAILLVHPGAPPPMSRRLSDQRSVMDMPSISATARRLFGPPPAARRLESAPAPAAVAVKLLARADENSPRAGGVRRLGGASHRLGVWTHHPPRGRARGLLFTGVNTCPVSGLRTSRLRGATLVFTRQPVCLLRVAPVVVSASPVAREGVPCV